jgi:putative effector of murein hydrolase LrgA (UPF0299 family)
MRSMLAQTVAASILGAGIVFAASLISAWLGLGIAGTVLGCAPVVIYLVLDIRAAKERGW